MSARRDQSGFSLIELAVVLVIVGLLVGGGLVAFEAGTEQSRRSEQRRQFDAVRVALYGFAMTTGRLPCPDTRSPSGTDWPDGREDVDSGECNGAGGALPWVDLGVGRRDAWGSPLRYRVTTAGTGEPDFADAVGGDPASFEIGDEGELNIYSAHDASDADIAERVVAVVVSYGPQGGQVWTAGGFDCPEGGTAGLSDDENANCTGDDRFVDAGYRPPEVDHGFDDMLMWIPYPVLSARMVEAGRLP